MVTKFPILPDFVGKFNKTINFSHQIIKNWRFTFKMQSHTIKFYVISTWLELCNYSTSFCIRNYIGKHIALRVHQFLYCFMYILQLRKVRYPFLTFRESIKSVFFIGNGSGNIHFWLIFKSTIYFWQIDTNPNTFW